MARPPAKATTADKVRFLSGGAAYGLSGPVEVRETHMAWVFLAGDHVFKLKKPLKYPYLDFTALEARAHFCREELRLNRRLAPDTYLDVVALKEDDEGRLSLAGPGTVVDWVIKMRRLPASLMLDHLIREGAVSTGQINRLGLTLSEFYKTAGPACLSSEQYLRVFEEEHEKNRKALLAVDHNLPRRELNIAFAAIERGFKAHRPAIGERATSNHIVDGHGDLRPEHVCLSDPPVIIDCLEFSPRLRMVDPFDDLSYLSVECRVFGAAWIGTQLIECCASNLDDRAPKEVLAFYTVYRCCLRARLAVAHLLEPKVRTPEKWIPEARKYLAMAMDAAQELGA